PAGERNDVAVDASFTGTAGDIPLSARARMDGAHLEVVADAPRVRADTLRAHFPDAPIYHDGSIHPEANGDLPHLALAADAGVGDGAVHATGDLNLPGEETRLAMRVDARGIDLRAFAPNAQRTSLAATARVALTAKPDGTWSGTFAADVP